MTAEVLADYSVSIAPDGGFVYYLSRASARNAAEMAQRLRAATGLGEKHGLSRIMFDARGASFQLGLTAQYNYAYHEAAQLGLTRSWRVAILVSAGERSYDFIETALINAGYNARLFTAYDQARAWLSSHPHA